MPVVDCYSILRDHNTAWHNDINASVCSIETLKTGILRDFPLNLWRYNISVFILSKNVNATVTFSILNALKMRFLFVKAITLFLSF